jgi:hypothetical protein
MDETGRTKCPHCGRFCADVVADLGPDRLERVTGVCATHGVVDLSANKWAYEDFDEFEDDQN